MAKIALVEDNPDNRMLVMAILESTYEISEYENGIDALAGIRISRPDLMLLDISLPGMDGGAVLKVIKHDPELRTLPVIALTAHSMRGDREKYLDMGFDGFLSKPIEDENFLFDAIKLCLESKSET